MGACGRSFRWRGSDGRVGVSDDIGPLVASLLGRQGRWRTGQRIELSDGQTI